MRFRLSIDEARASSAREGRGTVASMDARRGAGGVGLRGKRASNPRTHRASARAWNGHFPVLALWRPRRSRIGPRGDFERETMAPDRADRRRHLLVRRSSSSHPFRTRPQATVRNRRGIAAGPVALLARGREGPSGRGALSTAAGGMGKVAGRDSNGSSSSHPLWTCRKRPFETGEGPRARRSLDGGTQRRGVDGRRRVPTSSSTSHSRNRGPARVRQIRQLRLYGGGITTSRKPETSRSPGVSSGGPLAEIHGEKP